jgi:DMSO/TMAO reductase YedYZ molybdopterin-dependent catalytic subunit
MLRRSNQLAVFILLLGLPWMICPAQDKSGDAVSTDAQAEAALELRGDLPNPHRIDLSELHKLPRAEVRTTDPRQPGKEIVYAGTPLAEILRTGGLPLGSGMPAIRDIVTMTVLIQAVDGYQVVFSLPEIDPALNDRMILLADTKDGQPLPGREGPFRIIVPGDKIQTRWVRQVKALVVHKIGIGAGQ